MTSDTFPLVLCPSQFPDWIDCIHSLRLSTPYCGQYFFFHTGKQYYSIQSIINMCQQILLTSYMIFELLSSYDRLDFNNSLWFKRKLQRNIKKYTFLYSILKFELKTSFKTMILPWNKYIIYTPSLNVWPKCIHRPIYM